MSANDPSGHWLTSPSDLPVCYVDPARCLVLSLGGGDETARLHKSNCRLYGDLAARGSCAAVRESPPHRRAYGHHCGRRGSASPHCGVCVGSAAIGLDRRKKGPGRLPLGRHRCRHPAQICVRIGRARPRRHLSPIESEHRALLQATRTVPIVFTLVADPVGAGYVDSLAHPGGNATGFTVFDYSIGGKWLELLKEIAPRVTRVAVLRELAVAAGPAQFSAAQTVAPSLGMELRPIDPRDVGEI